MSVEVVENKPLFRDLSGDDPEPETTEIESLCMNCHSNGVTRLLLTKIPFYKEVILMSFSCDECGYANNEIQSGGPIAQRGVEIKLSIIAPKDLNRQIVKSENCSVTIPELDFEIPAKSQNGEITTVESILERSINGLEHDQPLRRLEDAEFAGQIDTVITKFKELKEGNKSFTLVLKDISGNSFIENTLAPQTDPQMTIKHFTRTEEEDHELGIYTECEVNDGLLNPIGAEEYTYEDLQGEVLQFATNCNICNAPCETNMKVTDIPHFKEVVLMSTVCDVCGNRSNEVKSGGGIETSGIRIEVDVATPHDLKRDLLKSETCHLLIPQLDLEVGPNALNGRFTTVEGILVAMKEQLTDHIFQDSQDQESKDRLNNFLEQFDAITECKMPITLVLDDPAGNSYIQSMHDDGTPDKLLRITHYERSFDQNEELGLNDMKTEDY